MSRKKTRTPTGPVVRCAIYTRKSHEDGLEQEFNTLDAQRESGEAYIASQKNEGWECLAEHYDDGGFSGGNMDRPALARLLAARRISREFPDTQLFGPVFSRMRSHRADYIRGDDFQTGGMCSGTFPAVGR
jgi:hypothetical protein